MIKSPLVEVDNVSVIFGKSVAVENVSINIYRGDILAIIGLNGAGKTTLLKAILGIYKPATGSIKVHTKRIGYVPQVLNFDRTIPLTVKELLQTYRNGTKKVKDIEENLGLTGALHLIDKKVGDLSGGELQRVMLANALLSEPELLLLDEPTTGIDVIGEKSFFDIIKSLHDQYEIAIVLVSHDIHMVYRHATQIVCINRRMMCQGPPHEVAVNGSIAKLFGGYLAPYEHEHD